MTRRIKRSRFLYLLATGAVIVFGLVSRRYPGLFPAALGKYPGDALWAMMVFCGLGFLFRSLPTIWLGVIAFAFSCTVEFSQLYHAPWIDSLRDMPPGRLILGRGFSWVDIGAYGLGIAVACLVETLFRKIFAEKN